MELIICISVELMSKIIACSVDVLKVQCLIVFVNNTASRGSRVFITFKLISAFPTVFSSLPVLKSWPPPQPELGKLFLCGTFAFFARNLSHGPWGREMSIGDIGQGRILGDTHVRFGNLLYLYLIIERTRMA